MSKDIYFDRQEEFNTTTVMLARATRVHFGVQAFPDMQELEITRLIDGHPVKRTFDIKAIFPDSMQKCWKCGEMQEVKNFSWHCTKCGVGIHAM